MSFLFLDQEAHQKLDTHLQAFLDKLPRLPKEPSQKLIKEALRILESVEGKLIRPNWQATWRDLGCVSSAWFENFAHEEISKALHDVINELVRLVMTTETRSPRDIPRLKREYVRQEHPGHLRTAFETYMDIQGRSPAFRSLTSTDKRILAHCRKKAHKGERIANALGLSFDYTRGRLARLVKEGRLRKVEDGYRTM